jgi:hypothetical protein
MGILDYMFGSADRDPDDAQPAPSNVGRGPDVDAGRKKTKTERDLRRVQESYDPDTSRFKDESPKGKV